MCEPVRNVNIVRIQITLRMTPPHHHSRLDMTRRRRTGGSYDAGVSKKNGTPTVNPPTPQGIDQYSGFKVNLSDLKKDWQGLLTVSPDRRNPQDNLRGIKDNMALPYASPEPANEFVSQPLIWENGDFIMAENGTDVIYSEGINPTADEL